MQEQVAELEAKLAKLTAEFNAANHDKQEVREHRRGSRVEPFLFGVGSYFRKTALSKYSSAVHPCWVT